MLAGQIPNEFEGCTQCSGGKSTPKHPDKEVLDIIYLSKAALMSAS